jgi:hypothetical protein
MGTTKNGNKDKKEDKKEDKKRFCAYTVKRLKIILSMVHVFEKVGS